ncbi:MAG: heme transporter HemC, partial [Mesorhizobium sp.]
MSDTTSRLAGLTDLANPTRFVGLADKVVPWLAAIAAILLGVGVYMSFTAPEDFQQGIT